MNALKALALDISPYDTGTLWTMCHSNNRARCALLAWPADWELRVIVDGMTFLSQRCPRGADAFELAETWKRRMVEQEWTPILPQPARNNDIEMPVARAARAPRGPRRR